MSASTGLPVRRGDETGQFEHVLDEFDQVHVGTNVLAGEPRDRQDSAASGADQITLGIKGSWPSGANLVDGGQRSSRPPWLFAFPLEIGGVWSVSGSNR